MTPRGSRPSSGGRDGVLDATYVKCRRIRINNVQERANREIKRRTRAVQVFPSVESMIRLVGAVMAECDEDRPCRHAIASMDLLEKAAAAEPGIDREMEEGAERLILVAMESAGMAGKAA